MFGTNIVDNWGQLILLTDNQIYAAPFFVKIL